LGSLGSTEGLQALGGGSELDAALMGAAGGDRFRGTQSRFGNLDALLDQATRRSGAVRDQARNQGYDVARQYGAYQEPKHENPAVAEAEARRAQDAERAKGRQGETRHVSDENYAAKHGLTLEEWIRAGEPYSESEWARYYTARGQ
jgi:hypothetical protein